MAGHDEFLDAFSKFDLTRQNPYAPEDDSSTPNNTNYSKTHPRRQPHHEISFEYPALKLLFPGEAAWIPPPDMVEYRTKPQKEDLRQDFYVPEVYHYMHPIQPAIDPKAFENQPTALNLVQAVDSLSKMPGRSTISVCLFKTPQNEIFVRLEIKRISPSGNEDFLFWKLSISDWTALQDTQSSRPWLQLLMDVVYRKTVLTYLITSHKLQAQNGYLWRGDAEKWERKWNTRSARHAVTLFQNRLKMPGSRLRISVRDFDTAATRGEGKCRVQLPCGHAIQISKDDFQDLTGESCKTQTCPTCNALIMQKPDFDEAEMCANEAELQHAVKMSDGWTELGWNDLSTSVVRFDKSLVLMALHSAAWNLKAPALIASKYLNPFGTEETDIAIRALEAWLQMQQQTILRSPSELVEILGNLVLTELRVTSAEPNMLEAQTPPGWKNFLQLWLTRAVKFAYQRGCDEIGEEHEGTHLHASDGLVYYQTPEAQRMQAMNALLGGMGM